MQQGIWHRCAIETGTGPREEEEVCLESPEPREAGSTEEGHTGGQMS